jgi:hypothetical protein
MLFGFNSPCEEITQLEKAVTTTPAQITATVTPCRGVWVGPDNAASPTIVVQWGLTNVLQPFRVRATGQNMGFLIPVDDASKIWLRTVSGSCNCPVLIFR